MVNDSFETSIPVIFACGNVLHVHDLVDFVCEEAKAAGKHAVKYLKTSKNVGAFDIKIKTSNGVRYTVPQFINPEDMDDKVVIRFRVANIYKDMYESIYVDDRRVIHKKRQILAPGEMETLNIKKSDVAGASSVLVTLEEN